MLLHKIPAVYFAQVCRSSLYKICIIYLRPFSFKQLSLKWWKNLRLINSLTFTKSHQSLSRRQILTSFSIFYLCHNEHCPSVHFNWIPPSLKWALRISISITLNLNSMIYFFTFSWNSFSIYYYFLPLTSRGVYRGLSSFNFENLRYFSRSLMIIV